MKNIKALSAVLVLSLASTAGVAFAGSATGSGKAPSLIEQQCQKEFGANKAKVSQCIKNHNKADSKDAASSMTH